MDTFSFAAQKFSLENKILKKKSSANSNNSTWKQLYSALYSVLRAKGHKVKMPNPCSAYHVSSTILNALNILMY